MDIVERAQKRAMELSCPSEDTRIMALAAEEIIKLRGALRPFADAASAASLPIPCPNWQCLVSAKHLSDARDALGVP